MKAADLVKIWSWLEKNKPGASSRDLESLAQEHFGEIKWDSQMGYGEGQITCTFLKHNIKGSSCGYCTVEEALLDALAKLL